MTAVETRPLASARVNEVRSLPATRTLVACTMVHLGLPVLMFVGGWLRPILAIPLALATLAAIVEATRQWPNSDGSSISRRHLLVLALAGLALARLSGAGGFGYQTTD